MSDGRCTGGLDLVTDPRQYGTPFPDSARMISHKYKCIFVEVPKTGSTSVRCVIGMPPKAHLNIWQLRYELETHWTHYGGVKNRILAGGYLLLPSGWRARIGRERFKSYFKFGFVRNPWDRAVSLYERVNRVCQTIASFEEFIDSMTFSSFTCIHPVPHRNQLDWFVDPDGNVIVDFIGRFETLDSDWALISAKLGISQPLPHANKKPSRSKHYTEYYTQRTRQIIAERFRVDIGFFGYEFDGRCRREPAALVPAAATADPDVRARDH